MGVVNVKYLNQSLMTNNLLTLKTLAAPRRCCRLVETAEANVIKGQLT